jgi:beta-xylosidase
MMKIKLSIAACLLCISAAYSQQTSKWGDQQDGTFRNPVLAIDYSDPDPICVNGEYYMATSTFEASPGVVILHSTDMVNWKQLASVIEKPAELDARFNWNKMDFYGKGAYAPSLRYHDGKFWVFVNLKDACFYAATTTDPKTEKWKGWILKDKNGKEMTGSGYTDPCPFWDEEGKAYLAASHPGGNSWYSYLYQMTPDGKQLLDVDIDYIRMHNPATDPTKGGTIFSPHHSSEGNKIYKINKYYYIVHIEFLSLKDGHAGTYIYRSENLYGTKKDGTPGAPGDMGEYEVRRTDPWKPAEWGDGIKKEPLVKEHYQQRFPGQGGFVTLDGNNENLSDGNWWYISQFNNYDSDGRRPCLVPVTWIDGWPVLGVDIKEEEDGMGGRYPMGQMPWQLKKPVPSTTYFYPQGSDEFNECELSHLWEWHFQPRDYKWSLTDRKGHLRIYASETINKEDAIFKCCNIIRQRHMRSDSMVIIAKIDISHLQEGQRSGLINMNNGQSYAAFGIICENGKKNLYYEQTSNKGATGQRIIGLEIPGKIKTLYIRSFARFNNLQTYQYSFDGKYFIEAGAIGGTAHHAHEYVYTARVGAYRGNMIGIYTYNNKGGTLKEKGWIDIDWFHYDVYAIEKSKTGNHKL